MQLGMIGLGRMGANMVRRLMSRGHSCVVHAPRPAEVEALAREGAHGTSSLPDLVAALAPPRVVWLMVPAPAVEGLVAELAGLLQAGDILVDGGNSHFVDAIRRAGQLRQRGITFLDVGTSGGIWGRERGYCLMIGGEAAAVKQVEPLLQSLAPGAAHREAPGTAEAGYLHCGPPGAGHFVKMVHNGIEYGLMAAYAEGFNLLRHANAAAAMPSGGGADSVALRYGYDLDLPAIAELWRHGSVVSSWLLDLAARALAADGRLDGFTGRVADSGEGRWTVQAALDTATPVPVLATALFARFSSRGEGDFGDRLLSALRQQFGGHGEAAPPPASATGKAPGGR
jgi:6-phosphogluconate dehydrogenase